MHVCFRSSEVELLFAALRGRQGRARKEMPFIAERWEDRTILGALSPTAHGSSQTPPDIWGLRAK